MTWSRSIFFQCGSRIRIRRPHQSQMDPKHCFFKLITRTVYTIYKFCLSVCPSVFNKRLNGWTVRAQFFVAPRVTPGKVYGWSDFQKFASIKIRFLKIWKSTKFFDKIRGIVFFLLARRIPMFFINKDNVRWAQSALKGYKIQGVIFFVAVFGWYFDPWIRIRGSAYLCGSGSRKPKSCGSNGSGS